MLYYVKTGSVEICLHAKDPRQAAIKTISSTSDDDFGVCIIVSEKKITEDFCSGQIYFLTDNILEDCSPSMKLVS